MTGNELFVKALQKEGIDYLFAYPGGYAIDIFDELYKQDSIQVILPRHEQGLIHAADGYARATGRTGVCLVTSGPGATNLVTGIATANYDSVPLVCFTGQVPTNLIGNDAFQEVDIVGITRGICKYAVTVRDRNDLAVSSRKPSILPIPAKKVLSSLIFQKISCCRRVTNTIPRRFTSAATNQAAAYTWDS